MDAHNQKNRQNYVEIYGAPNTTMLKNAYEKLLIVAKFPTPQTVIIPLNGFPLEEASALLTYFDQQNIQSTMEWGELVKSPQITIRDGHNTHLSSSFAQRIRDDQANANTPATQDFKEIKSSKPITTEPSFIPDFNILPTENKGFYILLDHIHPHDESLLSDALKSRNISFTERDSKTCGRVFAVPNSDEAKLTAIKEEALSAENQDRMPHVARIFATPPKGAPAINLLKKAGEATIYIPVDGMALSQKLALEKRLEAANIRPYPQQHLEFGSVYAIPEELHYHAHALSKQLRAEHNARKETEKLTREIRHQVDPSPT